ncbi:CoxG family protein [Streptomyces sp. NBC_00448]|uniref:CoxG family protein n=1 Tax=Streptomyces sp. NBC_00448 TaxID=2903652 RepID=UPI002E2291C4
MEHESFVPTPSARVAETFRTPGAVASALPGWQPDPDATEGERVARGRLRLRIAGSTITYRGFVTVKGDTPPFTLEARGTEVRGDGVVEVSARITLTDTELPQPGTTVEYRGEATANGRLASYDPAVADAAVRRLLDRFSAGIAELAAAAGPTETADSGSPAPAAADRTAADPTAADPAPADPEPDEPESEEPDVVDDLGDPSPELEEFELVEVEVDVPESAAALDDLVPPAEAAHARRTMIGRSAEEVDHAPPRGRYAPVPAPDTTSAATLRWAAPAAAALLASAVVVGRVLRRRR